jgi:hypothetical protein
MVVDGLNCCSIVLSTALAGIMIIIIGGSCNTLGVLFVNHY